MLVLLLALLFTGVSALAQAPPRDEVAAGIDAIAAEALARPTAGLSIAVARDGKIVFARGYGVADLKEKRPVTSETVFHIDSISKNILAAVLLQLVDDDKLSLDDEVSHYLPEVSGHSKHVPIRQLLNHTSGIFDFTSLPQAEANERLNLDHKQVLALFKDKPADFAPGTSWRYGNSSFYLAGMVVERVAGREYATYVREKLFRPLGMKSAQLCDTQPPAPGCAAGTVVKDGHLADAPPISWKLPWAAGAICASASDLVQWQLALEAGQVVKPETLTLMRKPTVLPGGTTIDYGLGTRLGVLGDHRVVGHTGSGGGFSSVLESFPDDHLIIVVLTNTDNRRAAFLAGKIARTVLHLPTVRPLDLPVPKGELEALLGRFGRSDSAVENFEKDGKLRFRPDGDKGSGVPLLRQAPFVYALDEERGVHFQARDDRATCGQLYIGGLMLDAVFRAQQGASAK